MILRQRAEAIHGAPPFPPLYQEIVELGTWNGTTCTLASGHQDLPCRTTITNRSGTKVSETSISMTTKAHLIETDGWVSGSTYLTKTFLTIQMER